MNLECRPNVDDNGVGYEISSFLPVIIEDNLKNYILSKNS